MRTLLVSLCALAVALSAGCKDRKKEAGSTTAAPAGGEAPPAGGAAAAAPGTAAPAAGGAAAAGTTPGAGGAAGAAAAVPTMPATDVCKKLEEMATKEGGKALATWNKDLKGDCTKQVEAQKASKGDAAYNDFVACMQSKDTLTAAMKDCNQLDE